VRVAIIQGHPDARASHFCHALAEEYGAGAWEGGHEVKILNGFAVSDAAAGRSWKRLLKGKSARIVVTMGMPAFFYKLYFRAHSLKSLKRNILEFCGVSPVRTSVIGTVEGGKRGSHHLWLAKMRGFGRRAA
jgi:putative NADPH-quinone reductase